ncbi:MAG TPA: sulfurtransferase [Propionibacteriaceae bacterium]|nr:sulfurtransferase [Propionibacteriaceae bacterium]
MADPAVLIQPEQLATELDSEDPPMLADVRWNLGGPPGRPEYEAGHLPGAQWVDLDAELSAPPGAGGRHPLPAPATFELAMRRIGLNRDAPIVVYDGANSLAAARLWWLLTDAGHTRVRVLDGGFAAWRAAGLPVESGPGVAVAPGDFLAHPGQRAQLTGPGIAARLAGDASIRLVDVRAPERYSGETEPIDPVAGHIPGAVNLPSPGNHATDGRFLPGALIADRYRGAGAESGAVLYCGSGITAAQSLLALESAGLTAAIYPGSWSDWITDPDRPIATGPA